MGAALTRLLEAVEPYTKSTRERLMSMVKACQLIEANHVAGDVVECGVWRGGNIILARRLCPDRVCWLFDTFAGMANPCEYDVSRGGVKQISEGKDAVSMLQVLRNFEETGTYEPGKLRFVIGAVEDTLISGPLPDQIALLRLDTDWYQSTKIELEVLWPRLAPGGVLIVDDYGHWLGCRKAVDEFLTVPFTRIDYTAIMAVKP